MRLKAFLVMVLTVAGLVVAGQSPAYAASCAKAQGSASVHAFEPYASTGYGPVTHGIQVLGNGKAWAGFYSGITNNFSPTTDLVELTDLRAWVGASNSSDNGGRYLTCVWGVLKTPYGPVGYGSQYRGISNRDVVREVRWGNYNFATKLFYPDSGGWQPIA